MNNYEIKKDFEKEFKAICEDPKQLKETTENICNVLLDELALEIIFETHRSAKIGTEIDEDTITEEDNGTSTTVGEKLKKSQDCICPICNRTVIASRFAPHLERCMGMSRKLSRNASRLLNNNNKERETSYSGMATDNEDDADWNSGDKRKRKKNNNNRVKKSKNSPKKNGDTTSSTELSLLSYEKMSEEEKKNLLTKFCGVVSERTKKICSRSLRCNLHSDEKRRALRTAVINDVESGEIVNVDVEGDDDIDTTSLKDMLQDNSNTSSPADSASNSNSSSSSRKREKTGKAKNKNSKKDRSSPNVNGPID